MNNLDSRYVWDFPLRLFHWLLVVSLIAAYLSIEIVDDGMYWHLHIGIFIFALIVFRLCWGFLGSENSRFKSFFPTYGRIKKYYFSIVLISGHSPHGAVAVYLMIFIVFMQSLTGLFAIDDDIDITGPFYELVNTSTGNYFTYLHSITFDILMVLVGLHVAAIIFYRLVKNNNLVTAMVFGYTKSPEFNRYKVNSQLFTRNLVISICIASLIYGGVESGQFLSTLIKLRNYLD